MSCLVRAGDRDIREYLRNRQISRVFSGNDCALGLGPKGLDVYVQPAGWRQMPLEPAGAATHFVNRAGPGPTSGLIGFFGDLLGCDMGKLPGSAAGDATVFATQV